MHIAYFSDSICIQECGALYQHFSTRLLLYKRTTFLKGYYGCCFFFRVSAGLCLTDLTVSDISEPTTGDRHAVTLSSPTNIPSSSKLNTGDMVMVSEANSKVVIITTGSIIEKNSLQVTLLLDR